MRNGLLKKYCPNSEDIKRDKKYSKIFRTERGNIPNYKKMTFEQMIDYAKDDPHIEFARRMPAELWDAVFEEIYPNEEYKTEYNEITGTMTWEQMVSCVRREEPNKEFIEKLPLKLWYALVEQMPLKKGRRKLEQRALSRTIEKLERKEFEMRTRSYLAKVLASKNNYTAQKELGRFIA
ncbi:MAG: hypothetical protein Q8L29_02340 [archaeon]|nr:hypothetical protein [archaeon]